MPDRIGLIGAMNSIKRARKIHGARAKRIVRSALHMTRKVGPTPQHLRWRRPVRPLSLVADMGGAGPGKSWPSDPDPIPERLVIRQNQVSRRSPVRTMMVPGASLPPNWTVSRGIGVATGCNCEIQGVGETWRRSGGQKQARPDGGADQIAAHDFPRREPPREHERRARVRRDLLVARLWRELGVAQCIVANEKSGIDQLS